MGDVWGAGDAKATLACLVAHCFAVYGIVAELGPLPCPLTLAENYFEAKGGLTPYQGPFLLHYLDATVYPNLPATLLIVVGVAVCAVNLGIYGWRLWKYVAESRAAK